MIIKNKDCIIPIDNKGYYKWYNNIKYSFKNPWEKEKASSIYYILKRLKLSLKDNARLLKAWWVCFNIK